jgi:hypothetical protein
LPFYNSLCCIDCAPSTRFARQHSVIQQRHSEKSKICSSLALPDRRLRLQLLLSACLNSNRPSVPRTSYQRQSACSQKPRLRSTIPLTTKVQPSETE